MHWQNANAIAASKIDDFLPCLIFCPGLGFEVNYMDRPVLAGGCLQLDIVGTVRQPIERPNDVGSPISDELALNQATGLIQKDE
jgi:hypothetical protein